jgi:hypothetical protein
MLIVGVVLFSLALREAGVRLVGIRCVVETFRRHMEPPSPLSLS